MQATRDGMTAEKWLLTMFDGYASEYATSGQQHDEYAQAALWTLTTLRAEAIHDFKVGLIGMVGTFAILTDDNDVVGPFVTREQAIDELQDQWYGQGIVVEMQHARNT